MRRSRHDGTKVWHNPDVEIAGRRRMNGGAAQAPTADERRDAKKHRAALEALFAPKAAAENGSSSETEGAAPARAPAAKAAGRIVLTPAPDSDPKAVERQRLLQKLALAEGRPQISKIANELRKGGFTLPDEQDIHLKLLEHLDEDRVREAIETLTTILAGELPKRRAVLESRLRRIEEYAEDGATRTAAERLRRLVTGRPVSVPSGA